MIEKGRHYNISREFRVCIYCETLLEDEYHLMLVCPLYDDIRNKYLPLYYCHIP